MITVSDQMEKCRMCHLPFVQPVHKMVIHSDADPRLIAVHIKTPLIITACLPVTAPLQTQMFLLWC